MVKFTVTVNDREFHWCANTPKELRELLEKQSPINFGEGVVMDYRQAEGADTLAQVQSCQDDKQPPKISLDDQMRILSFTKEQWQLICKVRTKCDLRRIDPGRLTEEDKSLIEEFNKAMWQAVEAKDELPITICKFCGDNFVIVGWDRCTRCMEKYIYGPTTKYVCKACKEEFVSYGSLLCDKCRTGSVDPDKT